jgi:hypothetical protein
VLASGISAQCFRPNRRTLGIGRVRSRRRAEKRSVFRRSRRHRASHYSQSSGDPGMARRSRYHRRKARTLTTYAGAVPGGYQSVNGGRRSAFPPYACCMDSSADLLDMLAIARLKPQQ